MHPHTGAMMRDLAVEQYSTRKDQCSSAHIEDTIVIKSDKTARMQLPTYLIVVQ